MKKLFALLLSLSLLLSAVVFAEEVKELNKDVLEGQTTVSLTISPEANEFVVIIPATVTIDPASQKGYAEIVVKAGWKLITANKLIVRIKETANTVYGGDDNYHFTLKDAEGNTAEYAIYANNKAYLNFYNWDSSLLSLTKTSDSTVDKVATLAFSMAELPSVPGVYTDVLTFAVELQ